jgi:hypothetical protein
MLSAGQVMGGGQPMGLYEMVNRGGLLYVQCVNIILISDSMV